MTIVLKPLIMYPGNASADGASAGYDNMRGSTTLAGYAIHSSKKELRKTGIRQDNGDGTPYG